MEGKAGNISKIKRTSHFFASASASAIANTIALLLIARHMGSEILGALGFILAFMGTVFFVGDMGNTLAFTKAVEEGNKFRDCYSAFLREKVKLTLALGVASGILIGIYVYLLAPDNHQPFHHVSLFIIMGYFLVANMAQTWVVSLGLRKKAKESKAFEIFEALGKVVAVVGIIWLSTTTGDQNIMLQLTFVYLLAATLGLLVVRNAARNYRRGEISDEVSLAFAETSSRVLPFVIFTALLMNIDMIFLWYFADADYSTLGYYFGGQRITVFIGASSIGIQAMISVSISEHLRRKDTGSVSETLRLLERYILLVVLPVAAFYILFSKDILVAFLGTEFAVAANVVSIMAVAGLFTALSSPHVLYLVKDGKYRMLAFASGAAFITLVCSLLLLVPEDLILPGMNIHGMNGAAISMLASSIAAFAGYRICTARSIDCTPHRNVLTHPLCAGVMLASLKFIAWYFTISFTWYWILIFAFLGVLIYGISLYLVGEFLVEDYQRFIGLTGDAG